MTPGWFYFVVALLLYFVVYYCVEWALRPKPGEWRASSPDWFWDHSAGRLGNVHGTYEEFKPEQTDRQESKPTSGAG